MRIKRRRYRSEVKLNNKQPIGITVAKIRTKKEWIKEKLRKQIRLEGK